MGQLSNAAMAALEGKNTLQAEIRGIIDGCDPVTALDVISRECSEFRNEAENWINKAGSPEDVAQRRKQVNNIINDISRMCRDSLGKSIVCVSRKGGYKYEPQFPKPRTTATTSANIPPGVNEIISMLASMEQVQTRLVLTTLIDILPVSAMKHLLDQGKDTFVELVNAAKELDKS